MIRILGHGGEVRVGYTLVARLAGWQVRMTPQSDQPYVEIEADGVTVDAFYATQRPVALRLQMEKRLWCWPEVNQVGRDPWRFVASCQPEVL